MPKLTLSMLLALTAVARAAPKDEAKAHIKAATAAYQAANYDKALVELQAAYDLDPQPDLLYAIGQAYAKLGKCSDAITFFERFRNTSSDPTVGPVIDQAVAACKPRDEASTPATDVTTAAVDQTTTRPPDPTKPTVPDTAATAATAPTPGDRGQADRAPVPPRELHRNPAWYSDKLGDGLVVGGVAASVVGLVLYRSATSDLDKAEASSSLAAYTQLVDDAHSGRTRSVVLFAAGGGLIVAGVVRYLLRGGGDAEVPSVGMVPATGGGLVTWTGRF